MKYNVCYVPKCANLSWNKENLSPTRLGTISLKLDSSPASLVAERQSIGNVGIPLMDGAFVASNVKVRLVTLELGIEVISPFVVVIFFN